MTAYFLELVHNIDFTANVAFVTLAFLLGRFPELRTKRNWTALCLLLLIVNTVPSQDVMQQLIK